MTAVDLHGFLNPKLEKEAEKGQEAEAELKSIRKKNKALEEEKRNSAEDASSLAKENEELKSQIKTLSEKGDGLSLSLAPLDLGGLMGSEDPLLGSSKPDSTSAPEAD